MNNGYRLLSIAIVLAAMGLFSSPAWAKKPEGNSAKASSNDVRANPDLRFSALAISDATSGNNNGFADPNECIELSITLVNNGDKKASGISATLSQTPMGSRFQPLLRPDPTQILTLALQERIPVRFKFLFPPHLRVGITSTSP